MSEELRQRSRRWRLSGFVSAMLTPFARARRARVGRTTTTPGQDRHDGLWRIPGVLVRPAEPPGIDDDYDDHDLGWLFPPDTVSDPAAWDKYWGDELAHGVQGFNDLFVGDGDLIDAMRAAGLTSVLCVGSGLSMEPHALAHAGFRVTALDLSLLAMAYARDTAPTSELLARLLQGRPPRAGGRVDFVTGDLMDAAVCPGPFDVIIDRRTLQLFPDDRRAAAVEAVITRLAPRGLVVSQCHDGGWKPGQPRRHALDAWFAGKSWPEWHRDVPLISRAWWRVVTTG